MSEPRYGAYAGSFDPITNGHLWVIGQALKLFDVVHVFVANSPAKKYAFDAESRYMMVRDACKETFGATAQRLKFDFLSNRYVVEEAFKRGCDAVVRGIRTVADYEYEKTMADVNLGITPQVQTVFLMPPPNLGGVSSSMVKGLIGPEGWEKVVQPYVSANVLANLVSLSR